MVGHPGTVADRSSSDVTASPADFATGGATSGQAPTRATGLFRPVAIAATIVLGLAGLFYAEITWLHTALPQDRVSRVVLAVVPQVEMKNSDPARGQDWTDRLLEYATNIDLLGELGRNLDLRHPSTGAILSASEIAAMMRVSGQCIEQGEVRGVLLSNVIRGPDGDQVNLIARAWSELFIQRSADEFPGLTIQPLGSMGASYEICR
jgi:hypothetical protein